MKKKIMIITQHFPPEIGAASNRLKQMLDQFQKQDIDVFVVTTKPNYPNPNLYTRQMTNQGGNQRDFHLYRSPIISGPFPDKVLRLINQFLFVLYALIVSTIVTLRYSVKICITTSPPFFVNFVGLYCKVVLRRRWIMEIRDLWPDSLIAVGVVKQSNWLYRFLKKQELYFYKVCDRIVIVTNRTKSILTRQGISEKKIFIITNGIPSWVLPTKKENKSESKIFNVSYIGNVGLAQNLSILLDVAEKLKNNNNIHFYIYGEGLAKKSLIDHVNYKKLDNISFINGTTDKETLIEWYQNADLGIVSLNESELFANVIPSKIFEYAACGTKILYLGSGEAADIIDRYSLGINIKPDAKLAAETINGMSEKDKTFQLKPEKRTEFFKEYSWDHLAKKYLKVIAFPE